MEGSSSTPDSPPLAPIVVSESLLEETVKYLCNVCPALLDGDVSTFTSNLGQTDSQSALKRFIGDSKTPVFLIQKHNKDDENNNSKEYFTFENQVQFIGDKINSLAIVKRQPESVLDSGKSIASQLQVINLGEGAPFDTLHNFIHNSVAPFIRSFALKSQANKSTLEKDVKLGIGAVNQKIAELELSLYNCKQQVQIPDIVLSIHPDIKMIAKKCKDSGRTIKAEDVGDQAQNQEFLNTLQAGVSQWVKDIQKVTKLKAIEEFASETSSTSQEINFWLQLEQSLANINEQLKSPEAECTLAVLKQAKRFLATASFDTDTIGLKKAMEKVVNYKTLVKDFPITPLLTATDVESVSLAITGIFVHLKKSKNAYYPIERYLALLEAVGRDMCAKVLAILKQRQLMHIDYAEFDRATTSFRALFGVWDDQFSQFRENLREIARKRGSDRVPLLVNVDNRRLQDRVLKIRKFRRQHDELKTVIATVLPSQPHSGEINAIKEINEAYDDIKDIDVLLLTQEGDDLWASAQKRYNNRIDRVESFITSKLRDRLASAKNANEMFRVFSKFNVLFFRPRIREAIQEYQTQLIERVKDDIKGLHEKFKQQYNNSEASYMSQLRDLPPVSGAIIWARQIERQLDTYMRRVEDVLGESWESDAEGQKLKAEGDQFRAKLNTDHIFNKWVQDTDSRSFEVSGRILTVVKKGTKLSLDINFDPHIIMLFKEVRNLQWLGFRVPLNISFLSSGAKQVYPFAVSLKETLRTYTQTCSKITPDISPLIAQYKKDVQQYINEGFKLKWESLPQLDPFVRKLSASVNAFRDKVDDLIVKYSEITKLLEQIKKCPFKHESFVEILNGVQKLVDEFNLASYSNLQIWVDQLDRMVEHSLTERLHDAIDSWISLIEGNQSQDDSSSSKSEGSHRSNYNQRSKMLQQQQQQQQQQDPSSASGNTVTNTIKPKLETIVHEIVIRNQILYLDPPLEFARVNWITQLHQWLNIVCDLPRIQSSRYDEGIAHRDASGQQRKTFRDMLTKLPKETLGKAYTTIQSKLDQVERYVQIWLQYQALWDMESSHVYNKLGEDLNRWQLLLNQIKKSRTTFDTSATEKVFGPLVIDYAQVQSSVNNKYDFWHKDILAHFGVKLAEKMRAFYDNILASRTELEKLSVESVSTEEAVSFIIQIQEMRKRLQGWEGDIRYYRAGQDLLNRQRFQFPNDWLDCDMVEAEWNAFNDILNRKNASMSESIPQLQAKILAESKSVADRIREFVDDWTANKPLQGNIKHSVALENIKMFVGRLTRLRDENERLEKAKQALDLDVGSDGSERLQPVEEEINDLKAVWTELSNTWQEIDQLRETAWSAVVPRKVRRSLEDTLQKLKSLPNRIRQYSAFDHAQNAIKGLLKGNAIITDLHSEAIKERHWKMLKKKLNANWILTELTLASIWDSDIVRNEHIYREVITAAQGEIALEEFLKQVREYWTALELDLVNYQRKCKLVRGWDDLFNKLSEHLNSISAMKMSPFYKVFEEEATSWDDKLNRLRTLLDVWIDVQRRWVYLEGIFSGSGEINQLLPAESSRFKSVNSEFIGLMKKVSQAPLALEVLNLERIQSTMERLAELLGKIQKALGAYLERQRAAFARFYFVGDEDLLEIIGNSKDIIKIQKHFRKMFAGLANLILDEEKTTILGMMSGEGETVMFKKPVSIANGPKIHEWLTMVEAEMRNTLALLLGESYKNYLTIEPTSMGAFSQWVDHSPTQLVILTIQIVWSQSIEKILTEGGSQVTGQFEALERQIQTLLGNLADSVLTDLNGQKRKKFEHLITELVHQRDVIRQLLRKKVNNSKDFEWLYNMRFYYDDKQENVLHKLSIHMANAVFYYGYEYLGIGERLVQTPLTDRCYLTLTQALESRMGGNPFGPAGTGKTETVKALGNQLGRFVLVFCCDEGFDFQAMSRIFVGLCQCGAWGCFDEFNRLEERILSAVSQQIQTIQVALKEKAKEVELIDKHVQIHPDMGIFVTMNPGYAGRSNLPDNLKQLFRSMAMIRPDREMIAQVMLYSQGFKTAEVLAGKIVPLFKLCQEQLSSQSHYDFGLRALKSVLVSAGGLKRKMIAPVRKAEEDDKQFNQVYNNYEISVLLNSITDTMIPKLVADDIPLIQSLLLDVFPGTVLAPIHIEGLREQINISCKKRHLTPKAEWVEKILQLHQIQNINHGLMMVGPSGSGKSASWNVYLEAIEALDGVKSEAHVMDPKAINKEQLFGSLDTTTREWTDGLFTATLRRIIDNVRGESSKRHWIIFDGDVDPEWVENLNSLLDDNKLLTLPNGERLALPSNVRIVFEVQDLKYATLATISRCGMVWFSEEVLTTQMIFENYLETLDNEPFDEQEKEQQQRNENSGQAIITPGLKVQKECAAIVKPYFEPGALVHKVLEDAAQRPHIMDFTRLRALNSFFSLLNRSIQNIVEYNFLHPDFPMSVDNVNTYITNRLLYSLMWGLGGSMGLSERETFSKFIQSVAITPVPASTIPLLDYAVNIEDAQWSLWKNKVPTVEVETHKVASPDVVIPTVDTTRHVDVLHAWLSEHRPLILCGPPGSGKTMTLTSTLRAFPDYEVVSLNFSSATTPELILKTFDHHCEYKRTPSGDTVLRPVALGKWLVVFCDEINLPSTDKYGTQRVITFIRQLVEKGGFWRTSDHTWIRLEKIQFVGACNPPTDAGRVPLSHRFLRHAPLLLVDFPSTSSLTQIYGTFNRSLMKLLPNLRAFAESLTDAMVEFYSQSQKRFTPDKQAHYIYSPRELSRWVRALLEAIQTMDGCTLDGLVRLWAHEGLRLFQDRLVDLDEREWTDKMIDEVAFKYFPNVSHDALKRPILYSNWLSKDYVPVDRNELREYVKARLKVFYEEELDVPLVLFNEVLDHILRIDRVFRQPQGHALLIGVSGGGKSVLSRFVAWMNGLSIYTIKVNNNYKASDFDDDLRMLLKRAGCKEEKICFIFDESNVLESSFLERMNTLLAGGEVPGLFEGEEYTALMHQCKETAQRNSLIMDTEEELYKYFTSLVRRNLHVVFTMNPASPDFHNRSATSPALFNRCVLDWFGEWSQDALFQVGAEFTRNLDLENQSYIAPPSFMDEVENNAMTSKPPTHRDAVVSSLVYIHQTIGEANIRLLKRQGRQNYVTPRHYLDFINQVVLLINEKREQLEEEQLHLNIGLKKLRDTEQQVKDLQISLAQKNRELELKGEQANQKLKQMVQDQQFAETKQKEALELQSQLDVRNKEIQVQKVKAYADLEKAEPAIIEAQESVSTIKKKHLDEIKALPKPPQPVKLAMEAVCLMLTGKKLEWADIRKKIMEANFISSIVDFDTKKQLTSKIREAVTKGYLEDPSFNFEAVNRASKACGPLVKWVSAQAIYSDILDRVKPLREEVEQLESAAGELKTKQEELVKTIDDLNKSISTLKDEYATLIRDTESIKVEMNKVKTKVERSIALLDNLSSERGRWEQQSDNFQSQMSTVVGDVVLASAFLAYIGFFDQHFRAELMRKWMDRLETVGIKFKNELSVPDFLARPEERLTWQANSLPADDLCIENAIMLKRFNRYPLVIDPSGQAMEFLMNQYADKKITKTSFLDSSFMKNLESALRFGCPLLVQDVENIDPVLNPVLNKEIRKKGGRILIRLGDQDVDFSPSFMIFLFTRDPTAHFTPDLCSRVTFVNFTVTPSSLQSQCLHETLKSERPDTHKKRSDLLKVQGEFKVKLRTLEKSLLNALSQAQGNILDDDQIISTLESLKRDAAEIKAKVDETENVMQEISAVSAIYNPIALACSRVYFAMEQLSQIHHLYQFSLRFFLDIFYVLLYSNSALENVKEPTERLAILNRSIFSLVFSRVSRTLLNDNKITFALQLAHIALKSTVDEIQDQEWDFLLKGGDSLSNTKEQLAALNGIANATQQKWLISLRAIPSFGTKLIDHIQQNANEWKPFLTNSSDQIPESWLQSQKSGSTTDKTSAFRKILLMKAFQSDRVLTTSYQFVQSVFGEQFLAVPVLDMARIVEKESKAVAPLLLCSVPGYDASSVVDDLAAELRKPYKAWAIGSPEGFELAEKSIFEASKNGSWVLLKNIHLAPQWLVQLEKKLHSLTPHSNFRLFMTSEIHPNLPANLLRMSHIFSYENPPGVKANLLHTFANITPARMDRQPVERSRLYFLLAWFHAIIQERLRYIPLGWTKVFEYNDADLRGAIDSIDYWIDLYSKGRSNIDPDKIPWVAVRTILGQTIYGGRVDNEFDMRLLNSFLEQLFTPAAFNPDFSLVQSIGLTVPEGTTRAHFLNWIEGLPALSTPIWLGLSDNAESLLLSNKAKKVVNDLQKMQLAEEEDSSDSSSTSSKDQEDKPKAKLRSTINEWLKNLPKSLKQLKRTAQNIKDPLFRCFEREIITGNRLVKKINNDLNTINELLQGTIKQTNYLRSLVGSITKGVVPKEWKWYSVSDSVTLSVWMVDFVKRMQQLNEISESTDFRSVQVWLGGLLNPEAYITATRQSAAQINGWSLENLRLHIDGLGQTKNGEGFTVKGLSLEGAIWENSTLTPTKELSTPITTTTLAWRDKDDPIFNDSDSKLNVPVYLNDSRTELLFALDLPFLQGSTKASWYQRSVSISSWKPDF